MPLYFLLEHQGCLKQTGLLVIIISNTSLISNIHDHDEKKTLGTTKISFQSTSKSFGLLYLETFGKNIMVIPDVLMVARKDTFTLTSIKSTYLYEYNVFF